MSKRMLALAVVGLLAGATPQDDAAKKDLEKLQGTWILVSAMRDGVAVPAAEVKKTQLTIEGNRFRFPKDSKVGTSVEGTFTIDPAQKPKAMDSTASSGTDKGKTSLGIYEIEDGQQKVCFAPPGKERPKEFASKPGSGYLLQTWKRQQP